MKTIIFFTTLFIFLHSTTYHLISTEAKVGLPDPVRDEDGNPLLSQYNYYVLPGGVIPRQLRNKNCTFGVSQTLIGGLPVGFYQPPSIPGGEIRESLDANIMFTDAHIGCNSSGVWKVDEYDEPTGQYFIVTDGVAGNPGNETVNSWFKIERVVDDHPNIYRYKFVYSPEVCPKCIKMDNHIDFFSDGPGMGFLALAETSYVFKFRRFVYEHGRYLRWWLYVWVWPHRCNCVHK